MCKIQENWIFNNAGGLQGTKSTKVQGLENYFYVIFPFNGEETSILLYITIMVQRKPAHPALLQVWNSCKPKCLWQVKMAPGTRFNTPGNTSACKRLFCVYQMENSHCSCYIYAITMSIFALLLLQFYYCKYLFPCRRRPSSKRLRVKSGTGHDRNWIEPRYIRLGVKHHSHYPILLQHYQFTSPLYCSGIPLSRKGLGFYFMGVPGETQGQYIRYGQLE